MTKINNETEYKAIMARIEQLLKIVNDDTPKNDTNYIELVLISNMAADYEDIHYPIETPKLVDVIKLRMFEMNLTQKALSEMLGLSQARVSEILKGKSEPTLPVARNISQKLNIDASIVLGV
ncbi:MAG: type II toxin-antitoxin system HigA family antitoxin [Dysgonomonas sp.]